MSFLAAAALVGCAESTTQSATCGNNVIEGDEQCDGGTVSCPAGQSGTAVCNACKIEGCVDVSATCGNNQLDTGEDCDGTAFAAGKNVCPSGTTGTPSCNNCQITGCTPVSSATCGNSKLDAGEECDGAQFAAGKDKCPEGTTGTPVCSACKVTGCTAVQSENCGNRKLDAGEDCDGSEFAEGKGTCPQGYEGTPTCNASCKIEGCTEIIPEKCGNDTLDEGEVCDGSEFAEGKDKCPDGYEGTPTCSASCKIEGCTEIANDKCGNDTLDEGEDCDGSEFAEGKDECPDGYEGTPVCNACKIEGCTEIANDKCGNDALDEDEDCDGDKFAAGKDKCPDGYEGTPVCNKCQIEGCTKKAPEGCGNGKVDNGEDCDGDKFAAGKDKCPDGYEGTPICNACTITGCVEKPKETCGNGKVDNGEDCDGKDFAAGKNKCPDGYEGTPVCNKCQIEGCKAKTCGNKAIDKGEKCDGDKLDNKTCNDILIGSTGKLKCKSDCSDFDTSECKAKPIYKCEDNVLKMCEMGKCDVYENCSMLGKKCDEKIPDCVDNAFTCDGSTIKITGTSYSYDCKKNKDSDDNKLKNKLGCAEGIGCTDIYCDGQKLMECNDGKCSVSEDCSIYNSKVKCSLEKLGCVCDKEEMFCYTNANATYYAICDESDIITEKCKTSKCDINEKDPCTDGISEKKCGNGTLGDAEGEQCDWQMDGDTKMFMSVKADYPTCNYYDPAKVFVSGQPKCVEKNDVCKISVEECVEAKDSDFTAVKEWKFTSQSVIDSLTNESTGTVLIHHGAENNGFKPSQYVSGDDAWQLGSWIKGGAPNFDNFYMWFKVGDAKKKTIQITFDVKRAGTGPQKLRLQYLNGNSEIGQSAVFEITESYKTASFVVTTKDVVKNFSFKLSAYSATNEGTMSIRNVQVKSLDSAANNDDWLF